MLKLASRQPKICCFSVIVLYFVRKIFWLFNIGPLTRRPLPVRAQNHWLRAFSISGSFSSFFRLRNAPRCSAHNTHSSHSSSSCCITRMTVDFDILVTSFNRLWLVLGGWLLVCLSKAVLLASIKSLCGILAGIQNFTKSRVVTLSE